MEADWCMLKCSAYILTGLFTLYISLKLFWHYWTSSLSFLNGPPCIPLLGSSHLFERDSHLLYKQTKEWTELYGSRILIWFGLKPMIFNSDPIYVEAVLKSQSIIKKSRAYDFTHPWLKTGLLTSTGSKWKTRRRLLTPSFHFAILNDFVSIFEDQADKLVEKLSLYADDKQKFDVQIPVSLALLDVICETSMGVKINAQDSADSEYVQSINTLNDEINTRQKYPWLWSDFIYQFTSHGKRFYKALSVAHSHTLNVIKERIALHAENKDKQTTGKKKFFLDLLIENFERNEIDVEGIQEEVDTFMFEGHDTTASALSWTLYELAGNKSAQKRLHEEIDKAEEMSGSTLEKVQSCKFIESCLKEAMRLHPPVPLFGRTLEEDTVIDGQVLPKNTDLVFMTIQVHTHPDYWKDPLSYTPERFEDEAIYKRHPYAYVPFSAGPRNCIGQKFAMNEEKVFLYKIMRSFHLERSDPAPETIIDIIDKSRNGIWIKVSKR